LIEIEKGSVEEDWINMLLPLKFGGQPYSFTAQLLFSSK